MESKLQSDIIRWLRDVGCYVIKTRPGPGMPVGCPDVIALYKDKWMAIEVKAKPKASFQPGQQMTIQRLLAGNIFVYVANPENWSIIKQEIIDGFL